MPVHRIRGNRSDLTLAFSEIVQCAACVDDIVNRIDNEVALPCHQVVLTAFDKDAFLNKRLHESQDVADIVGFHRPDGLVLVAVHHCPDPEIGENLAQDRSLHPSIDDVSAFRPSPAGGEGEFEVFQVGVGIAFIQL
jgi:hypothetical protein